MKSKAHLFEIIAKVEDDRRSYFEALFKYIPEEIVKEMSYEEVKKNETILSAGASNDTVFFVLKGQVTGVEYKKPGNMYSFMDFTKMNVLGDFEAFGDIPQYDITLCAMEDCMLLKLSTKSFLNWVRHDENALFLRLNNIIRTVTAERRLDREYLFLGCKERLMLYLIRLYEKNNIDISKCVKVEKTQAELADKVGFNIRSVQRSVATLAKENLITMLNGKIHISYEQYLRLKECMEEKRRS